jgi:hypothetical protein
MRKNMKLTRIFQNISIAVIITALGLTSCDYLDVVPPEQPNIDDAMSSPTRALGFLYSCYGGVSTDLPSAYLGEINSTTDEYVLPYSWNTDGYWGAYAFNTASSTNQDWLWGTTYQYIGQCYLFLQKLENAGSDIASDAEKEQWRAECQFLVAYYHFATLRRYGPIPITDSYIPMDTPTSEYNGRFHFDYCVDWIANQLDEAAKVLPANRTVTNEWGRATSTIAKAVKARLLLYAASPLWNGSFPYPNWQNENFETPGYGKALVSNTYDKSKWERALAACQEALTLATTSGDRELYDDDEYYSRQSLNLPFVPGVADVEDNKEFLKNVMKMRYAVSTRESEGNKEIIWGLSNQFDFYSRYPLRILKKSDGTWHAGYSGVSPTLYTFEHFYTANGKLPEKDLDFTPSSEWFESAGISSREDIIKLNVGREPRFYVSIVYGGMSWFIPKKAGERIYLEMYKNGNNGPDASHNHFTTGYNLAKLAMPEYEASPTKNVKRELPYMRYAEILLNYVEATIEVGDLKDPNLFTFWNAIRNRAGLNDIEDAYPEAMNDQDKLRDLIHRERRVELAFEGINFYDCRRWLTAEATEKGNIHGMNIQAKGTPGKEEYPEDFFQRTVVEKRVFTPSFYLFPIPQSAINKNQDLVQNYKW